MELADVPDKRWNLEDCGVMEKLCRVLWRRSGNTLGLSRSKVRRSQPATLALRTSESWILWSLASRRFASAPAGALAGLGGRGGPGRLPTLPSEVAKSGAALHQIQAVFDRAVASQTSDTVSQE
jgi:hypothetical protein